MRRILHVFSTFGLAAALFLLLPVSRPGPLEALPPYIPLADRLKESDVVIVGDIVKVTLKKLNSTTSAGNIQIRVVRTIKGSNTDAPPEFSVSFLVFPKSLESRLRKPPPVGRHFIFLKKKKVRDKNGKTGIVVVLYRPHPFSYEPYEKESRKKMEALIGK